MIPLDVISTLIDGISSFINAVINTILVLGVGLIYGIIIAIVFGFLVLGLVKTRDRFRKKN